MNYFLGLLTSKRSLMLLRFSGSVYFAIFLIAATALFVLLGTFLESHSGSHQLAAQWSYSHPFFQLLLWGFFINILFSALFRWPFKLKHVPFLITHLGLLMILAGTLIKNSYGVQGHMRIKEGKGTHFIILPNSYALQIEKRDKKGAIATHQLLLSSFPFKSPFKTYLPHLPELVIEPISFVENSETAYESWLQSDDLLISGISPITISPLRQQIEVQGKRWNLMSLQTNEMDKIIKESFIDNTMIVLSHTSNGKVFLQRPLYQALQEPIEWEGGKVTIDLQLNHSSTKGFQQPALYLSLELSGQNKIETMVIDLDGPHILENQNKTSPEFGALPTSVDLVRTPTLLLLKEEKGMTHVIAFGEHGEIYEEPPLNDHQGSIIMYDQGFGGYTCQAKIPFGNSLSRLERHNQSLNHAIETLQQQIKDQPLLAGPLRDFALCCDRENRDFSQLFVELLLKWNNSHCLLLRESDLLSQSLKNAIAAIDWNKVDECERKASFWFQALLQELEPALKNGKELYPLLKEKGWPLLSRMDFSAGQPILLLGQQLYAARDFLPDVTIKDDLGLKMGLLSAYLRMKEIHWQKFIQPPLKTMEPLLIESPLHLVHRSIASFQKLEENRPLIKLKMSEGKNQEEITLQYDPEARGIKWPVLNGKYLVRFQPYLQTIPYHIRLRQARQINQLNASQPYSYEADLIVSDEKKRKGRLNQGLIEGVETTLTMNRVYETWEGYRFYLSNISTTSQNKIRQIQLVVNRDPAKYFLTYPGAFFLSLGILLLFWFWPYTISRK